MNAAGYFKCNCGAVKIVAIYLLVDIHDASAITLPNQAADELSELACDRIESICVLRINPYFTRMPERFFRVV